MKRRHFSNRSTYNYKTTYAGSKVRQPSRFRMVWPKLARWLLVLAPIALIIYGIFYSPLFSVKHISVEGFQDDQIISELNSLQGRNIFRLRFDNLNENIKKRNPDIATLNFIRGLPDTIVVRGNQRVKSLVWRSGDKNYILDQNGILFVGLKGDFTWANAPIPVVFDASNTPVTAETRIVTPDFIAQMQFLKDNFTTITGANIAQVLATNSIFQVDIVLDSQIKIKLSLLDDISTQLADVSTILKSGRTIGSYIDLRVAGYAYYK